MRNGCESSGDHCPLKKPFTDRHHLFYPRSAYRTPIEKAFRDLPENKVDICRCLHNYLHRTEPIPKKPSREEMLEAIRRNVGEAYGA